MNRALSGRFFLHGPSQGATENGGIALSAEPGCRLVSIHLGDWCRVWATTSTAKYGYLLPSGKLTWLENGGGMKMYLLNM